jgi:hypothetical protein
LYWRRKAANQKNQPLASLKDSENFCHIKALVPLNLDTPSLAIVADNHALANHASMYLWLCLDFDWHNLWKSNNFRLRDRLLLPCMSGHSQKQQGT